MGSISAEEETIRCLLCRGIVTFSEKDDARYKDHLKVEHRVYFYMSWLIEKTLHENKDEPEEKPSELKKLLLKPTHEIQEVQISDSEEHDHFVIDSNEVEEEIDDDEEGDDDLAWQALNNVQAQIGDVSDDCIQITDENGVAEVPFSPQQIRDRVMQMAQLAKIKMMSFSNPIPQDELAANLAKIKATLTQNGVQVGQNYGDDSIVAEDDEADYSNQSSHFMNQSNGFGEDGMDPEMNGTETKKAFLLVYPGEDGKSISYRCSICTSHKSFDSKSRAEQHLKTHIPLHERKRFQCPQCKERFITAKNLERHIKLAMCQGIKIYSCTVCKQQFDNKFDLGDHKKSTHQQFRIKHNCETCGEGFRTREALKRHVRRHTGEKPFTCEICQKAFKTSSYVKTHKKTQHNIEVVDSPMKTMPQNEGIGAILPMNGLNEEETLPEEEDSEENENGLVMNLENGVYAENGVEDGANDDHADSEDTEDTNGGDTEDTNGGDTEDTNGDTDYEAMNGHTEDINGDTFEAMNGMSQQLNDEPMENDDESEEYSNGMDNGEPEVFRNGRDNSFNEENGQNGLGLIIG